MWSQCGRNVVAGPSSLLARIGAERLTSDIMQLMDALPPAAPELSDAPLSSASEREQKALA